MNFPLIECLEKKWMEQIQVLMDNKTKPLGALGVLEKIACRIGAIQKTTKPSLERALIVVFAGDYDLVEEGISLYPREVTAQMVHNFLTGGAAINVLARQHGADLFVADIGVAASFMDHPYLIQAKVRMGCRNPLHEPALTREEVKEAITRGMEIAYHYGKDYDVLIAGEMGIGNTSSASLLLASVLTKNISEMVGSGTGVTGDKLVHKRQVLERVMACRSCEKGDAISLLEEFGGLEICGMVGFYLAAASMRKVIILDGFISTAAYALARILVPTVEEYVFLGHLSREQAHKNVIEELGLFPLLQLEMRLGEGTGAIMALPVLRSATRLLNEMASFDEAGVSRENK